METFDYDGYRRRHMDAFTVMAGAIKRQYAEEEIPEALPRVIAKIIDDGFLDRIIAEKSNLANHQAEYLHEISKKLRTQLEVFTQCKNNVSYLESKIGDLEYRKRELEKELSEETDPLLIGAKKSYHFILNETGDKHLASKAFNSYLLTRKTDLE